MADRPTTLRGRLRDSRRQLAALPRWFRLLLRVSLVALFALGPAQRITYWLTVGTITEAWPWLLWGEPYLVLADRMLVVGRPVTYLALLGAAFWALGFVTEPRRRERSSWKKRLLLLPPRAVYAGAVLACLAVLTPLTAINTVRLVRNWPPRTDHLLQENCGHCHSPYRPQHYIKSDPMWERTVRRMIDRNGAPVAEADAAKIVEWLQDYRGFDDSWMFKAKCERCHGRAHLRETPRTAEEWKWIVKRVGWLNTFAFRVDQAAQIEAFLAQNLAAEPPPEGTPDRAALDSRLELMQACNPCHSISLILEDGAMDDPRAMVERMSQKSPTFVPPDRIDALTEALEALPRDEDAFWQLFPHDILLELE